MGTFHDILVNLLFSLYFKFLHLVFWLWNLPKRRKSVHPPTDKLLLISATKAAELIRNCEITSASLIEAYIKRIEEINPLINAVVIKNFKNALKQASEVDSYIENLDKNSDEYKNLSTEKPLLGIPFTIKDSFAIKGLVCTIGLAHRKAIVADEDAEVVKRLKSADAILLAVTNVPEGIMWGETANTLFGRTNNPYDTRRTPGGSSGGEAALIASAGSLIGIGSDFAGSIRGPASFCGIYGFMPSPGEKSETILHLNQLPSRKPKIFYMDGIRSPYVESPHKEVIEALRKAVNYFEEKCNMPTYRIDLPLIHESTSFWAASQYDPDYPPFYKELSRDQKPVDCYKELFKFFLGHSDHTLPGIISGIQSNTVLDESVKNKILTKRDHLIHTLTTLLGSDGILLWPMFPTVATYHHQRIFSSSTYLYTCNYVYNGIWNAIGFPVVACTLGLTHDNMPIGVSIVGAPNSDRILNEITCELEKEFGGWRLPGLDVNKVEDLAVTLGG
uniref:Amidase domain-containing protein n=1 Tax=Acrobeloides nanus TaxID=290746 RepID=A0A914C9T4_9BILA